MDHESEANPLLPSPPATLHRLLALADEDGAQPVRSGRTRGLAPAAS